MIYHITSRAAWERQENLDHYHDPSLEEEGFIHCSTAEQVQGSAGRYFAGRKDLVLLWIDPEHLESRVVYENLYGGVALFPHAYGPLNRAAITKVTPMHPRPDGSFELPPLPPD